MQSLALCTTVYASALVFLPEWSRSVQAQTDGDFELWIALDGVDPSVALDALEGCPRPRFVQAGPGDTPAQVRQKVLAHVVEECDAVVLVDSDDLLHPTRVAAARAALEDSDVAGCALRLVDERGRDLDLVLALPAGMAPHDVLPRHNVYGLSNTAYRCPLLRRCLPIPAQAALVDWYLADRAWLCGARFSFDPVVRMDYRQYDANMARTRLPFTLDQIRSDTGLVRSHFRILRDHPPEGALIDRLRAINDVAADVEEFYERVILDDRSLETYAQALNALAPTPLWWASVAHPALRHLWTGGKEPR